MSIKKKEPPLDLLQKKEARLTELKSRSDFAVQTVKSTIDDLASVNEDIQQTIGEIDQYLLSLSETKSGLDAEHKKNAKVMQNFAQLLCLD